jgi:formate dehydrogenase subunit delta
VCGPPRGFPVPYHLVRMEESKMIHRANEIARFWAPYPRDEAVAGVLTHIKSFWEPRFRRQLVEYADSGGAGLHDLVQEAVGLLSRPEPT